MKRSTTLTLLVVLSIALVAPAWCRDVVVSLHNHTQFSDGDGSLSSVCELAGFGADVVVVNDHAEALDSSTGIFGLPKIQWGFDNWLDEMNKTALSSIKGRTLIYGMELGLGAGRKNHMLVLAPRNAFDDGASVWRILRDKMVTLESMNDALLANLVDECRMIVEAAGGIAIAAHPVNKKFIFKKGAMVDAYEVFNHGLDDSPRTFMGYVLANSGKPPVPKTVVAGTDLHFLAQEIAPLRTKELAYGYVPCTKRFTIVQADDASAGAVVAAMKAHRCYAAFDDARIRSMTVMPGMSMPAEGEFLIEATGLKVVSEKYLYGDVSTFFCIGPSGQIVTWDEKISYFGFGGINASCRTDFGYRFKNRQQGAWQMYILIADQILTSAIEVVVKAGPQVAQERERSGLADFLGTLAEAYIANKLQVTDLAAGNQGFSLPPVGNGVVYHAQEEWRNGMIEATYQVVDDTRGVLTILSSAKGAPQRFDVQLAYDNCGLMSWTLKGVRTVTRTTDGLREVVASLYVQDGRHLRKDVMYFDIKDVYEADILQKHPGAVGGFLEAITGKSLLLQRVQ